MYSQLGNTIFQGLAGFNSKTSTKAARVVEFPLLDGKSQLQKIGDELETLAIDIYLHRQFVEPSQTISTLEEYMADGAILPLIDGAGTVYGDFVLISISNATNVLAVDGGIVAATLTITLKEYVDKGGDIKASQNALKQAIAISENGVVPVRNTVIAPSPLGIVTASVTAANSASVLAVSTVDLASSNPSQSASLLKVAAQTVEAVVEAAKTGIAKVQEVNSLAQKAPQLLAAFENVRDNANLFKSYCENGDLNNALTQGGALTDNVGAMNTASIPLQISAITRKP